jgi:[ribosomal protein S5]-alanine N-acetyltransferase
MSCRDLYFCNMKISFGEYCIRSFEYSDEEALVKYANNPNVSRLLRDLFPSPYTKADARFLLKHACKQKVETNFAIANIEELIGAIGLTLQEDVNRFSAEIGYWLAEPYWGKGIATEALKIFTGYVFQNFKVNRLYALVFEGNDASEKVLIKAGYQKEGTLKKAVYKEGKFLDQYIYAILNDNFKVNK